MLRIKVADKSGDAPAQGQPWPLSHVEIPSAPDEMNFSPDLVNGAVADGTASIKGGEITFLARPKNVVYRIMRAPGVYCAHCGAEMGSQAAAQVHIAAQHSGKKSPDSDNPSGYRQDNFFACERVS